MAWSPGRAGVRRARVPRPLLVLVATALVLVSACTGGSEPGSRPTPSPSSTAPSSPAPVTIRLATYGDKVTLAAYRRLAQAFSAEYPNVTVKLETSPDLVTAQDKLERGFAAGTAPDVFLEDHDRLPALVAEDRVEPLDELLEERDVSFGDNYQRLGLEGFAADSRLQCMPNDVSPYVVFYNQRMLDFASLVEPGEDPPTAEIRLDLGAVRAGRPGDVARPGEGRLLPARGWPP